MAPAAKKPRIDVDIVAEGPDTRVTMELTMNGFVGLGLSNSHDRTEQATIPLSVSVLDQLFVYKRSNIFILLNISKPCSLGRR